MAEWCGVGVMEVTGGNTEGEERDIISVEMVEAKGPLTATPSRLPDRGALDF